LKVVYSPRYHLDIGPHVFPTRKYPLVHDRLVAAGVAAPSDVIAPRPADWTELARVHSAEYLAKMRTGELSPAERSQLELPWSAEMVDVFRTMVGGTIEAARLACDATAGIACHIGGGLHHAFPNHGEGFCPFNDVAVAVRHLQSIGLARLAVVDLDVHHGNGTAFIFNPRGQAPPREDDDDSRVFTFSMHQQHNYPMWKPRGSLDIGLPDGAGDARFLRELERALPAVLASAPQCVFYLAGADPFEDDQLGGLKLTREGLRARDRLVIDAVCGAGVPLVVTLAGGYARRVDDTVAIHAATIEEASRVRPSRLTQSRSARTPS
jgi:acetoin utilization deacetylase AcuC-like enzyme